MTWLAWRQHRVEIAILLVATIAVALATIAAWNYDVAQRSALGVDTCVPLPGGNANCVALQDELRRRLGATTYLFLLFYAAPALVGSYLGGPLLSRELERGLHRLVWTTGSSRLRWAVTKLALIFAAVVVAASALALVGRRAADIWFWLSGSQPFDAFDIDGVVLVAYALFGLALGAFVGTLSRRVFTGMFVGLLAFILVRGYVEFGLRPTYVPPATAPYEIATFPPFDDRIGIPSGAWMLGLEAVDAQGQRVPAERVNELMSENMRHPTGNSETYLHEHGVYHRWRFQPPERYPLFQAIEASIFITLAAGLAGVTLLLIRRRDA